MTEENLADIPLPQVVRFQSNGVKCLAIVAFDERSLNMKTCQINLGKSPSVNIEYIADFARVRINDGAIWLDTTGQSAAEIEALFETGNAP